jgi:hypothetical protein
MATRTSRLPITRLRFRGHAETLNAICRCLQEHPKQALTAAQLADFTDRPFADVHQRLSETPELFTTLPKTPTSNQRYRLTLRRGRNRQVHSRPDAFRNAYCSGVHFGVHRFVRSVQCDEHIELRS